MPWGNETERRRTRQGVLTLEEVLQAFERDKAEHVLGSPSTEEELARLEQALGVPLPTSLRAFLARLGGGLFFRGHEIFGTRRVLIHDIEMVPDILTVRRTLAAQGVVLPAGAIPFHRARGTLHFMRLDAGAAGTVESIPASAPCADLPSFFETVVLPRLPAVG